MSLSFEVTKLMSNASKKKWGDIEEKRKKLLLVINSVRVQDLKLLGMTVMPQVQAISTVCKMMARQEVSLKLMKDYDCIRLSVFTFVKFK